MKKIAIIFGAASLLLLSFAIDPEMARLYYVRTEMSFNNPTTKTEVYIFTDWNCPKSRQLNHTLANIDPNLQNNVKFYFIDIHPEQAPSLTKINQALLFNKNKELNQYLKAREQLFDLAIKGASLTDEEAKTALSTQQLDFPPDDVLKTATTFFELMKNNFKIQECPSILIYQLDHNQSQTLEGEAGSDPEKLVATILELQKYKNDSKNQKKDLSEKTGIST
jgi:hypothetical protein